MNYAHYIKQLRTKSSTGGPRGARQCLEHGLIDEIVVHIVPVLLGTGTPFSSCANPARVDLEPVSTTHSGPVTTLCFRVRK
jgi:riboflavin biosynthesis pyrimidine reductase